jgi:hypothetical protein
MPFGRTSSFLPASFTATIFVAHELSKTVPRDSSNLSVFGSLTVSSLTLDKEIWMSENIGNETFRQSRISVRLTTTLVIALLTVIGSAHCWRPSC